MVRPSPVMNQSRSATVPLRIRCSISASSVHGAEMKYVKRSAGQRPPRPRRCRGERGGGAQAKTPPKPPQHAQTESEPPAQRRFHERSHWVALTAESTYAVAHVVPARSYRLRAAATLHTRGAAASRTQARAAGGL